MKRLSAEGLPLSDVTDATTGDSLLQHMIQYVQSGWPHQKKILLELRPYYSIQGELSVKGGCLMRENDRIIVTFSLWKRVLQMAHIGHLGIIKMKCHLRCSFWWLGLD